VATGQIVAHLVSEEDGHEADRESQPLSRVEDDDWSDSGDVTEGVEGSREEDGERRDDEENGG
jgi:hypothetical protein